MKRKERIIDTVLPILMGSMIPPPNRTLQRPRGKKWNKEKIEHDNW